MIFSKLFSMVLLLVLTVSFSASGAKKKIKPPSSPQDQAQPQAAAPEDDSQIVQAVKNRKDVNFVAGADMLVKELLPDDQNGLPHQKWVVQLSSGQLVQAISNLDMCPKIPVKVGDKVGLGGQFIWTKDGGLVHWMHGDPKGLRPNGYVELDGKVYCNKAQ